MIPPFDQFGNLPAGVYPVQWAEVVARFGWNQRRRTLLFGLWQAAASLHNAGCSTLYLGGSFVSTKEEPGDFDGCWETTGVDTSQLEPTLLDTTNQAAAQKAKYGGELYQFRFSRRPNEFEEFQIDRAGRPRGILALKLDSLTPGGA